MLIAEPSPGIPEKDHIPRHRNRVDWDRRLFVEGRFADGRLINEQVIGRVVVQRRVTIDGFITLGAFFNGRLVGERVIGRAW